ncbi:TolC family protein [Cesiribacter sp. SM1]|uniref:TolC family protein n=1 Tax=Cesiribacter sp. SM1 TaxID=2861196 RepID=UPI001CD48989|nr:TolC family protein [Cesiribacter sp. SM1]
MSSFPRRRESGSEFTGWVSNREALMTRVLCSATIILTLFFISSTTYAQQQAVSLDSALRQVDRNNPLLQQWGTRARAREAAAEGSTAWMPPMVGGGVFMMPYPGQDPMPDQRGSLMLSAEQDIPNPVKQRATRAYFNSRASLEEANRAVQYNQLRAEVKQSYYSWLVLEKKMAVLEENQRIMEFMLKLAKIRYPYSQGNLGSIYMAEARLHEVENMQLMTATQIRQQNIQLNTLMNLPRQQQYSIDTSLSLPEPIVLEQVDTAYLSSRRSDIGLANRTIASMRLDVERERLQRLPDFRIRFDHMTPLGGMMPQQFTLMGMVSIPIAPWSSRMYRSGTRAMNLDIQAMEQEREGMLIEAEGMARAMAVELNSMRQQVENYRLKIIPALHKNYDATMLAYEQNTSELPMVIDAWEALNMAQMEYLNKLQSLYEMAVEYERIIEE